MAIMALALTAFFALSQSAVNRIDKAYANWERTHLLSQAAEYYLLFADEEPPDMPPEIFESNIYDVEMRYEDAENLPEELNELTNQAPLRTLIIDLVTPGSREVVDTLNNFTGLTTINHLDYECRVSAILFMFELLYIIRNKTVDHKFVKNMEI